MCLNNPRKRVSAVSGTKIPNLSWFLKMGKIVTVITSTPAALALEALMPKR
jgi:hypothetical protein